MGLSKTHGVLTVRRDIVSLSKEILQVPLKTSKNFEVVVGGQIHRVL